MAIEHTGRERIGPKTLLEDVRGKERMHFPIFQKGSMYIHKERPERYHYHSPSHHVERGLLTGEMLGGLVTGGKTLLSVGSGAAHLEQLLVLEYSVPPEQITFLIIFYFLKVW